MANCNYHSNYVCITIADVDMLLLILLMLLLVIIPQLSSKKTLKTQSERN